MTAEIIWLDDYRNSREMEVKVDAMLCELDRYLDDWDRRIAQVMSVPIYMLGEPTPYAWDDPRIMIVDLGVRVAWWSGLDDAFRRFNHLVLQRFEKELFTFIEEERTEKPSRNQWCSLNDQWAPRYGVRAVGWSCFVGVRIALRHRTRHARSNRNKGHHHNFCKVRV